MAYRCRECGSGFTRGCAFRTHQHVHARVQGQQGRVRFAGTEPYDPSEYPARVLARDDDDADGGGGGGSDVEDPTQPVRVALSVEEEIKLRLCELKTNGAAGSGLSEADMTNILRIVALAGHANTAALFATCDELTRHMLELVARHPELSWYVADVHAPSFPDAPPVKVIYRRLADMLIHMVSTLDIKWGFWDFETTQAGDRIYAHPCGAELFEAVCKLLEGTGVLALALQLWSDKANLTKRGNVSYYPLSCVILSVLFEEFREQWPDSAIAFLPVVQRSDLPSTLTDREFSLYKAEIDAACLERVLMPVFSVGHTIRCVDNTGTTRHVVAMLHSWCADFVEQLSLAGLIGQTGCTKCDVGGTALLPTPDAEDDGGTNPRTATTISAAVVAMKNAWAAGKRAEFDKLRTASRQQGNTPILLTLFKQGLVGRVFEAGLRTLTPATALPFDTLHVFDEGWKKRLVAMLSTHLIAKYGKATGSWLIDTLILRYNVSLDMAFIEETKWPDSSMVFRGKKKGVECCSGLQACEMRAVFQLLPLLLPGILGTKHSDGTWRACDRDDDYLTDVIIAYVNYYMELKRYNRPRGHTERTFEILAHLGDHFLRVLRLHFLADQKSGFAFPKAHQGFSAHVPDTIRSLGTAEWLSTEWGENSVKSGHAAYEATNKHTDTAEEQMAVHLAKRAATSRALAEAGLSAAPAGLGVRRTALREARRTGDNTLALESICRVAVADFVADPLPKQLVDRPGMASFASALTRFLSDENRPDPVWVALVNSATLCATLAHHPDEHALIRHQTVYAAPSFRRRRRLSFVALEGVGSDGRREEWIAQLLLLFRLPDGTPLAYVQFLVSDTERAGKGPLYGTPNCAPLVWERLDSLGRYSYAVTHLDKLIRREFVAPDLCTVFASKRLRQRRAARRRARIEEASDDESNTSTEESETSTTSSGSDSDDDVATHPAEDGVVKRWPFWIRNPFIWGW